MIYARSLHPATRLMGAFAGVALAALARQLHSAATALLRRI